jgi:colanic acid biosynthesis glycosyl transferase WcaI
MRILIYGTYFPPEQIGIGKYTGEMAIWLVKNGHEVRVVTAPPFYPAWRIGEGYSGSRYQRELWQGIWLWRCPIWVPSRQTGIKRVLHLLSFALSTIPAMVQQLFWKPDIVLVVAPPLFCTPAALIAARLSGAKAWLHLQDFEIDAAFEIGLLCQPALRRFALWVERLLMRRFDRVSTISRMMLVRLLEKGVPVGKCVNFPNWVDSEVIHPLREPPALRIELGIPAGSIIALYSGNMGEKQGLETVLKAAERLSDEPLLRFVLCGEGATRKRLELEYGDLANVIWLPLQPSARLNELLNLADIHLLPQRADMADLVMPSKLTGMLASGRPVVATASAGTQVAEVVAQCGIVVPPGDDYALGTAIQSLARDRGERQRMGTAARKYAIDNMTSEKILKGFEQALISCCSNTP